MTTRGFELDCSVLFIEIQFYHSRRCALAVAPDVVELRTRSIKIAFAFASGVVHVDDFQFRVKIQRG